MRGGTIEARGDSLGALSGSSVFPVGPDVGSGMWAHPRTRWLDNVDSPPSSGLGYNTPHHHRGQWNRTPFPRLGSPMIELVAGVVLLAVWGVLQFFVQPATPWIHVLLAAGVVLVVRGIVISNPGTPTS